MTNVKSTVAEHTTSLSSITSRVSTTETNITSLNGNVSSLDTRLDAAEQKITDAAIISTVSSTYVTKTDAGNTYATKTALSTLTQTVDGITGRVEDAEGNISTLQTTAQGLSVSLESVQSTASTANTNATSALNRSVQYGTCATAAGTAAKAVTLSNFALYTGATVHVKFTYANSVANPTLNVNSTGAKAIRAYGAALTATSAYNWVAGSIVTFVYDGTYWNISDSAGLLKANDATTAASNAQTTANTARTEAAAAAKTATNFMSYDSTNGLLIGNKSSGSWSGNRAQVTSSAFNVLDSSGTQLASFGTTATIGKTSGTASNVYIDSDSVDIRRGTTVLSSFSANQIDLGINSDATVVNFCNGTGSIKNAASGSGWKRMLIQAGDSIELDTSGEIDLYTFHEESAGVTSESFIDIISKKSWTSSAEVNKILLSSSYTNTVDKEQNSSTIAIRNNRIELSTEYMEYSAEVVEAECTFQLVANDSGASCRINADGTWISGEVTSYGDIRLGTNNKALIGTDNNGADRRLVVLNANNNCVINYDGYIEEQGNTNVYGNEVNILVPHSSGSGSAGIKVTVSGNTNYSAYVQPIEDANVPLGTASMRFFRLYQSHSSVSTSDKRQKENIKGLGKVKKSRKKKDGGNEEFDVYAELFDRLEPVEYNFIEGGKRKDFGLIAQEVLEVMTDLGLEEDELDLVHHDTWIDEETGEEKDTYGIAYENLIALLIHEVQKLKKQKS